MILCRRRRDPSRLFAGKIVCVCSVFYVGNKVIRAVKVINNKVIACCVIFAKIFCHKYVKKLYR